MHRSPTGGLAFGILYFFLHLNPHQGKSFRQHVSEFDFVGFILFIGGVVCILIGFNFSEIKCKLSDQERRLSLRFSLNLGNQAATIAPLVIGIALLILAMVNEFFTKRSPIMPPRLFKVCPVVAW